MEQGRESSCEVLILPKNPSATKVRIYFEVIAQTLGQVENALII